MKEEIPEIIQAYDFTGTITIGIKTRDACYDLIQYSTKGILLRDIPVSSTIIIISQGRNANGMNRKYN